MTNTMTNTTTKKPSRSEELTQALATVEAELACSSSSLGEAVADDDAEAAQAARTDVERLEKTADELRAAIPICRQREAVQRQAEAEKARRATEREANKNRKQRLAAAKKVDAALRSLGRAFSDYLAIAPGGTADDANRLARRSRQAIAAATFHAAPDFANAIEPRRRPMKGHHQPLADAVDGTVRSFEDEDEDEA